MRKFELRRPAPLQLQGRQKAGILHSIKSTSSYAKPNSSEAKTVRLTDTLSPVSIGSSDENPRKKAKLVVLLEIPEVKKHLHDPSLVFKRRLAKEFYLSSGSSGSSEGSSGGSESTQKQEQQHKEKLFFDCQQYETAIRKFYLNTFLQYKTPFHKFKKFAKRKAECTLIFQRIPFLQKLDQEHPKEQKENKQEMYKINNRSYIKYKILHDSNILTEWYIPYSGGTVLLVGKAVGSDILLHSETSSRVAFLLCFFPSLRKIVAVDPGSFFGFKILQRTTLETKQNSQTRSDELAWKIAVGEWTERIVIKHGVEVLVLQPHV
jgi:hypothetical protein